MSLEFTQNKSNIGSGALNDLMFILYCRVIGQRLPTRRWSVGNQSAISWGAISNRLAIGRRLVGTCILSVCFWLQKVCNFLEIGQQPIGDWSAISRQLKTVSGLSATAATGRRSVTNQSATSRQPVGDHQKPFYDRFDGREVTPCDHPKFWSQGGCKLCVTGALDGNLQGMMAHTWNSDQHK